MIYVRSMSYVHLWIDRVGLDSTDTHTFFNSDSYVAIISPRGSPRVFHDPVVTVSVRGVSYNESGVVLVLSTSRRV